VINFASNQNVEMRAQHSFVPPTADRYKKHEVGETWRARKPVILVVDDEAHRGQILSVALKLGGFCSSFVCSGEQALRVLETSHVDAVLSDLNMPGLSGMELLRRVRRDYPWLAFVLLTERDDAQIGAQAVRDGAEAHLVMPIQAKDLLKNVNRALERKRIECEVLTSQKRIESLVRKRTAQLQSTLRSVEASYESVLLALASALDLRDGQTGGHSRRVCEYSIEIAKRLGCSEAQLKTLSHGALLHDIGKLAVPDSILLKPGPLTSEEWVVMRRHVETGYELVRRIPLLDEVAELVLTHHERFDGAGYPRNLRGEEIPLCARIFAVADAFDAMTTERPYQTPRPISQAIAEIRLEAGRQFDNQVVHAFLDVPAEVLKRIQAESKEEQLGQLSQRCTENPSPICLDLPALVGVS
jgi:putative nucleotidyltransferase with HDIG domain